ISRGELVEIGGEFRIPEVMTLSGARLVEVGTTNRTHMADYERAIGPDTAAILKVHPSNYRVVGFTSSVTGGELARLARGRGVCFFHDVGSGLIDAPDEASWVGSEPDVKTCLREGADLVTFSGDKLFGGPQAGIIVGRPDLIEKLERHPLLRALRIDKMGLAALDATVSAYLNGARDIPVWEFASVPAVELERRARHLSDVLTEEHVKAEAVPTRAVIGGGSVPGSELPSWAVAVTPDDGTADDLHAALRHGDPPVIGRIEDERVLLDLRAIAEPEDGALRAAVVTAVRPSG
ncbi:MAG TPA: L-seryl-tRNA(Sec) selenium transferase, partial [Actinomycetota bacterium]|nr:L-seryl-tRNA(Sec) selenium transferase [Actinomycetota bacterium]